MIHSGATRAQRASGQESEVLLSWRKNHAGKKNLACSFYRTTGFVKKPGHHHALVPRRRAFLSSPLALRSAGIERATVTSLLSI